VPLVAYTSIQADQPNDYQLLANRIFEERQSVNDEALFQDPKDLHPIAAQRRSDIQRRIRKIQDRVCAHIEAIERNAGNLSVFKQDVWQRHSGGGGITRAINEGKVFEKGGVNVSVVHGTLPPHAVQAMKADHSNLHPEKYPDGMPFFACGVSVVVHAHNPKVPTTHCNYRYFEVGNIDENGEPEAWWVGGGSDLTPIYLFEEDAKEFHQMHKNACDQVDQGYYPKFKKWCDKYFWLKHRGESRGVGGIFFDDLCEGVGSRDRLLNLLDLCGSAFCSSYFPIVSKRNDMSFTDSEKAWQQLRRGRYVEFNLIWDRGTRFGLMTPDARIESILMSLPLTARWEYMHLPPEGSEESKLVHVLQNPRDWL
jgi:coproporphyrinogen III oxidase